MPDIAYLGPQGTFTEQAARALTTDFDAHLVPYATVPLAVAAVREGTVVAAAVPMENSVEGSVPTTLDSLAVGDSLIAVAETMLPVCFDVLVRRGTPMDQIATVASHPHALAQVRDWLTDNLPDAERKVASSTAAGAAAVAAGEVDASVSSPLAVEQYDSLERVATGVADVPDAVTRFLLVGRPGALPEPSGADRTSVAVVISDEVGTLNEMLVELSIRGINLSRIESRPTKNRLGEYRFFLDFDGHVADARIGDALTGLRRRCTEVRFLGSYPKADRSPSAVRESASEQAFLSSREWLAEVRAGRLA